MRLKNSNRLPRITKRREIYNSGEYKIRPYKVFPGESRGEPCVHPLSSENLVSPGFKIYVPNDYNIKKARNVLMIMNR